MPKSVGTIQVAEVYALWRAVARPAVALAKAGPSIQFLNGHWRAAA